MAYRQLYLMHTLLDVFHEKTVTVAWLFCVMIREILPGGLLVQFIYA